MIEASVDFPEDIDDARLSERAETPIRRLADALAKGLAEGSRGKRVREGYKVAIVGPPNAGKSSLLNRLLGRDAAIVAAAPGTTRDVLEHPLHIQGYRVLIADTAGLRATPDAIEAEGVRRAMFWAEAADLRLIVIDQNAAAATLEGSRSLARADDFLLLNKADLPEGAAANAGTALAVERGLTSFPITLVEGPGERAAGWQSFLTSLERRVVADCAGLDTPAVTRERHERLLRDAREHLARALAVLHEPELAAADMRLAARSLTRITGEIGVEEVLGEVFARFCIGK